MITLINISSVALFSARYIYVKQYTHASSIYEIYVVFLGNRTCLSTDYTVVPDYEEVYELWKYDQNQRITLEKIDSLPIP